MPGTRLSALEQRMQSSWESDSGRPFPSLRSISITSAVGQGLRGIRNLRIDFRFPVTFLSGKNGSGKSTVLSLAALAFHGVPGHIPGSARRIAGSEGSEYGYFTFQDFFHRGPGDSDVSGIGISWEFRGADPVSIAKQSDKWMRYERRPPRPVEFLGISRAIPSIELPALRNHFGVSATPSARPLSAESASRLGQVLARSYPGAEVLSGSRYAIRRCGGVAGYTSFNMGAGEDALITILARLEAVPTGSLVVIEELETGLHPAAQRRLVGALVQIANDRRLQIIGSTHSEHVLDQLPRVARILILKEGDLHRAIGSPSSKFALSEVSEEAQSELLVMCEDEFAAALIRQFLPAQLRRRVDIRACGAKSELALQAASFLRLVDRSKCLVIWDGDVSDVEAQGYVGAATSRFSVSDADYRLAWTKMPGSSCPERWSLDVLKTIGLAEVVARFGFASREEAISTLERCGLANPHAIPHELSQALGLPEQEVVSGIAACVAASAVHERAALVDSVSARLSPVV